MSNIKAVSATVRVLIDPRGSSESVTAVEAAVCVLSAQDVAKDTQARAKDARGALGTYIAKRAIAGAWEAERPGFMTAVDRCAESYGIQLRHGVTEGKVKVAGWRKSSTVQVYCSQGFTVQGEAERNPGAFVGITGLSVAYKKARELAAFREAEELAAKIALGEVIEKAGATPQDVADLRQHGNAVANDPRAVAQRYIDKALADSPLVVEAMWALLQAQFDAVQAEVSEDAAEDAIIRELRELEASLASETREIERKAA